MTLCEFYIKEQLYNPIISAENIVGITKERLWKFESTEQSRKAICLFGTVAKEDSPGEAKVTDSQFTTMRQYLMSKIAIVSIMFLSLCIYSLNIY